MKRLDLAPLAGVLALAAACTDGGPGPGPAPDARLDLADATGVRDLLPAGVAVDPTGARYYFDEARGLFAQAADGRYVSVMRVDQLPDPGIAVRPPFTDLVAIGPDRFAITAVGDGFLLDTALATMRPYFCYEPGFLPDDMEQRTDAVTYDPVARLIHAQPRTFDVNGELVASQVASYAEDSGADVAWTDVRLDIAAGGMTIVPGLTGLVLGHGSELLHHTPTGLVALADLSAHGVTDIAGLATDPSTGTLLVLDRAHPAILELDLAAVAALAD